MIAFTLRKKNDRKYPAAKGENRKEAENVRNR